MFRREFWILCSLAVGVLLAVAAAGFWVGHTIREDADKIALDTLPSLVDAGNAMSLAQDNWHRLHLLSNAKSAAEQAALIEQIRTNSNEGVWRDYGQSIYSRQEQQEYQELLSVRNEFMRLREQYFAFVQSGRDEEARTFLEQKLVPTYENYRELSKRLFEYNAQAGSDYTAKVVRMSRAAPLVLSVCGIVIFGFGLIAGLRGALVGLSLVSYRPKTENKNTEALKN